MKLYWIKIFQVKVEINEDEARLVQSWQDRTAFITNVELIL